MKTPNIWDKEVNNEWGKYCPQEIRNTFTGEQLCWLKSFADKYAQKQVKKFNYSCCCKSDSELLPKRLSNEAYKKAQIMSYAGFVEWWDEQQVQVIVYNGLAMN